MKNKFKILSLILAIVLLIGVFAVFAHNAIETEIAVRERTDARLQEVMAESSATDLIPIWLWIRDIDNEIITKAMIERGFDPAIYENEARFHEEIVLEITQQIEEQFGYEAAHMVVADEYEMNLFEETPDIPFIDEVFTFNQYDEVFINNTSLVDREIHRRIDEYISAKREIHRQAYNSSNGAFVERYVRAGNERIIFKSEYAPFIMIYATRDEIAEYARNPNVISMAFIEEAPEWIPPPSSNNFLARVFADGSTGTKSSLFNNGLGYRGEIGLSVAILEQNRIIANVNAPQLAAATASGRLSVAMVPGTTPVVDGHGTASTTVLGGGSITHGGLQYEGVVPNVRLFTTGFNNSAVSLVASVEMLLTNGVSLISASVDIGQGPNYHEIERAIDAQLRGTHLTFVVAAGNNNSGSWCGHPCWAGASCTLPSTCQHGRLNVGIPGKALNVITVGAAATTTIQTYSSHITAAHLPNKPDIAAPSGAPWINRNAANTANILEHYGGTSGATPIAAGVVAQMMQANPYLRLNPRAVKSRLILAVNPTRITTANGNGAAPGSQHMRERSGAGLVDAPNSVNAAKNAISMNFVVNSTAVSQQTASFHFRAGQRVRAVMVYDKQHINLVNSQNNMDRIDFHLRNSAGTSVASSVSERNNVRIIDFTIATTGNYHFTINPIRLVNNGSAGINVNISFQINDILANITNLTYNGTSFNYTTIELFDNLSQRRNTNVFVRVIRRNNSTGNAVAQSNVLTVPINVAGRGAIAIPATPANNANVRTFNTNEHLEITVHSASSATEANLISRHRVRPSVLF